MPEEMDALVFWPKSSPLPTSGLYGETWGPLFEVIPCILCLYSLSHKRGGIYPPYLAFELLWPTEFSRSDGVPVLITEQLVNPRHVNKSSWDQKGPAHISWIPYPMSWRNTYYWSFMAVMQHYCGNRKLLPVAVDIMWLWLAPSLHHQAHSYHLIDLIKTRPGNACQWSGWTLLKGLGGVVSYCIFIKFSINELKRIFKIFALLRVEWWW